MWNEGIKSKERVAQFGEVYTPENIVNDMLDLVKEESERLESTFLEPACGDGNFLVKILERKLKTASEKPLEDFDRNVFIAVSSIYAIDILKDNIAEAKDRMIDIIKTSYRDTAGAEISAEMLKVVKYVLDTNVILGDSLTGLRVDTKEDIIIAEWKMTDNNVNRTDYAFNSLNSPLLQDMPNCEYEPIHFKQVCNIKKKSGSASGIMAEFGL